MNKPFIIAGLCVLESEALGLRVAEKLSEVARAQGIDLTFKASIDKANRTSLNSFRGMGFEAGLRGLERIKKEIGVAICTDIHEPWQAEPVAEVADILQIPAFLCRQTDLIVSAAKTGKRINIKKAQYLAPWDMKYVIAKAEDVGNRNLLLCERGTCFGYNTLVVDMTSILEMKKFGYPVVFDATHSVQKPGGQGASTGGNREYAVPLAFAAAAVGADGFFFETHPEPEKALSDGANTIQLDAVETILNNIIKIYEVVQGA